MFSYVMVENPILVQIMFQDNIIDESGPWESLFSAVTWAEQYVSFRNSGLSEPEIVF